MVNVTLDASEWYAQEYYTAHIFKHMEIDWTDVGEIVFSFKNHSENEIKMNFTLTDLFSDVHVITDEMPILAIASGSDIKEFIPSDWGSAEIPAGFDGEIHIPAFDSGASGLRQIVSFGMSFAVRRGSSQSFSISAVRVVPEEFSTDEYGFEIIGNTEIQLPVMGEAIAIYSVALNTDIAGREEDIDVEFGMPERLVGITMTRDGRLTITEGFKDYRFQIYAVINSRIRQHMYVYVYDHWSTYLTEETGYLAHLPRPEEVPGLKNAYSLFINETTADFIRVFCVIVFVALACVYALGEKSRGEASNEDTRK